MKDILIIWTWIAGLSASVYAKRYELDITIIWELFWGTITKTHLIENWPWIKSISWFQLWMNLVEHVQSQWVEVKMWKISKITKNADWTFISETSTWESVESKTIIFATGSEHKELWIESEEKFKNKWVSYCATCDWAFFKNKIVWIVWGSDSAVKESLLLSQYASKVYLIHRSSPLRAEPINIKRIGLDPKIEAIPNANVIEIFGENKVEWIKLDTGQTLELQGLFIEIWSTPNSSLAKDLWVNLSEKWEVITDKFWQTNIPWFFAAWDITNNSFRQAIVSSAEWSHCANKAFEYLKK